MTDLNNETNKKFQICIDIESMDGEADFLSPNVGLHHYKKMVLANKMDRMVTDNFETDAEVYDWVHNEFEKIGCAGQVYFRVDDLDEEVA